MSGSLSFPTGVPGGGVPQAMARPMGAPPAGVGPVTIPQRNPGNILEAGQKLAQAHKMILEALPAIPLGTPLHESVQKVANDLGKHLTKATEDARMTIQTLMQAMRSARGDNQQAAIAHLQGAQSGAGGPPATPAPAPMPAPPGAAPMA